MRHAASPLRRQSQIIPKLNVLLVTRHRGGWSHDKRRNKAKATVHQEIAASIWRREINDASIKM